MASFYSTWIREARTFIVSWEKPSYFEEILTMLSEKAMNNSF
tara:strand:+ start:535 stop:660 length:126 start_codon:yes stop_codon:yes gene_type:complete